MSFNEWWIFLFIKSMNKLHYAKVVFGCSFWGCIFIWTKMDTRCRLSACWVSRDAPAYAGRPFACPLACLLAPHSYSLALHFTHYWRAPLSAFAYLLAYSCSCSWERYFGHELDRTVSYSQPTVLRTVMIANGVACSREKKIETLLPVRSLTILLTITSLWKRGICQKLAHTSIYHALYSACSVFLSFL